MVSNQLNNNQTINQTNQYSMNEKFIIRISILIIMGIMVFGLIILFIYLLYRRCKKYSQLNDDDFEEEEENEIKIEKNTEELTFFDLEKIQLIHHFKSDYLPKCEQNYDIQNISITKSIYSIEQIENEINENQLENNEFLNLNTNYQTDKLIKKSTTINNTIVKPNIITNKQQYTGKHPDMFTSRSNGQLEKANNNSSYHVGIRRVSSTPNLTIEGDSKKAKQVAVNETNDLQDSIISVDDANLFKNLDDVDDYEDLTLTGSIEEDNSHSPGSIGDLGSLRPLMPIQLPDWAIECGKPERGFVIFTVHMESDLQNSFRRQFLCVRILEARCLLSRNIEPRAGKFYVKVRLQPAGTNHSVSVLSLDQITSKSRLLLPDRWNIFSSDKSMRVISVRTPVRRAFRSPVFRHTVSISLPTELSEMLHSYTDSQSNPETFLNSINGNQNLLELQIDLKERNALKSAELHANSSVTHWRSSQLVGSVRIPLTPKIWKFLLHNQKHETINPLRRSTIIPASDDQNVIDEQRQSIVKPIRTLRFIRCFQVAPEDADSHGELTFGMQYNPTTGILNVSPLKCSAINLPKATKSLYLRVALCSNRKLIKVIQSKFTGRLSINAAEFVLGEKLQFFIEENLNQVCLILSLFAKCGNKLQDNAILIGRCVTGPSDLACGDGLAHWNAIINRQSLIRRTHLLV